MLYNLPDHTCLHTAAYKKTNRNLRTEDNKYENHIKKVIGNKEPQEITQAHISKIENKTSHLSRSTQKLILSLIRRIAKFGHKKSLCPNLQIHLEIRKINNEVTEDLTKEQLEKLLKTFNEAINTKVATMLKMVLYTGMRRGKLMKLQWNDLDFENSFIHIRGPKGGVYQVIPMNNSAYEILKNYPRTSSKFVFPGIKGKQLVNPNEAAKKIMIICGIPDSFRPFHGLRHTYASKMVSSGKIDLYTLQRLLTHKTPRMQRYAHLRDDALKKASSVANDIIDKAISRGG